MDTSRASHVPRLLSTLCFLAAGPLAAQSGQAPEGSAAPSAGEPTPAPRSGHADVLHGVRVPDPYRWMEELEAPETRRWVEAEDERARRFAAGFAGREALRDEVARLSDVRRFSPPWKRGGRHFYLTFRSSGGPGAPGTWLMVREKSEEPARVLIGDADVPEDRALARAFPGPGGRYVAYTTTRVGSRWEALRVYDVEAGETLEGRIEGLRGGTSGVVWAPDGRGFYYERVDLPPEGRERTARVRNERVLYHSLHGAPGGDRVVRDPDSAEVGLTTSIAGDGRWLLITERDPGSREQRILVADLGRDEPRFRELPTGEGASFRFVGSRGSRIWLQTDRNAPDGRIVSVDLAALPPDGPPAWREVVPEADAAINGWLGARMVGRHLIVGYLVDARTEWRVFDLEGNPLYTLDLPRLGSVWSGFRSTPDPEAAATFYSLSGLADPGSIYRLDLASGESTLFARPELGYDPDEFVTRQVFYESGDGTRIPMYLVHGRGLDGDSPAPVIMYGYGFGGWSAAPWFQPHLAAWLRMGGAWALPNIRGGGEYGDAWRRAGSGRHKQTAVDDYLAAARWLVEQGLTDRELLVLNASSAGGAVGGAALVQRPELFGAAVLDYPVLDMLRYDRFTGGRRWRSEFGTPGDPEDFRALLAYSPYHDVRLNRCPPATLVAPGERDEVTPPLHAYKFVAALQDAANCGRPVLLRVSWGAGHSSGATTEDAVETWTDQLSFLVRILGRHGWAPDPAPLAASDTLVVENVHVVPMTGDTVLADHAVRVVDGTIDWTGPAEELAPDPGGEVVDGRGGYLLPGLVDAHVHLRDESELLSYLAHGVTTVVNLRGSPAHLALRDSVAAGQVTGPTIYTAGPTIDGDPPIRASSGTDVAATPVEARAVVADHARAGYDLIKTYNNLLPDALRAAVDEAAEHGLAVVGHLPRRPDRGKGLEVALEAGMAMIPHGEEVFFTHLGGGADGASPDETEPVDAERIRVAARLIADAGVAVTPNLSFIRMTGRMLEDLGPVFEGHPEWEHLSPDVRQMWREYNPTRRDDLEGFAAREAIKAPAVYALTAELQRLGATLLAGTDAAIPGLYPGWSTLLELEELVAAGLDPYEALVAGTRAPGAFLAGHVPGARSIGTIRPGRAADLVLVGANPLEDVSAMRRVRGVIVRGEWIPVEELERRREVGR